jgi:hypothetical protein
MKRSTAVLLMFFACLFLAALTSCSSKETWIGTDLEKNVQVYVRQPHGFYAGDTIVISRKTLYGGVRPGNTKVVLTRRVKQ